MMGVHGLLITSQVSLKTLSNTTCDFAASGNKRDFSLREPNRMKSRLRVIDLICPTVTAIVVYYQNYVAYVSPPEHQELVLTLNEAARKIILAKTRRLRRNLANNCNTLDLHSPI